MWRPITGQAHKTFVAKLVKSFGGLGDAAESLDDFRYRCTLLFQFIFHMNNRSDTFEDTSEACSRSFDQFGIFVVAGFFCLHVFG